MKSQIQIYEEQRKKISEGNNHFMEMISDKNNPLTKGDLEKLIKRNPNTWGKYEKFLKVLK